MCVLVRRKLIKDERKWKLGLQGKVYFLLGTNTSAPLSSSFCKNSNHEKYQIFNKNKFGKSFLLFLGYLFLGKNCVLRPRKRIHAWKVWEKLRKIEQKGTEKVGMRLRFV